MKKIQGRGSYKFGGNYMIFFLNITLQILGKEYLVTNLRHFLNFWHNTVTVLVVTKGYLNVDVEEKNGIFKGFISLC